MGTASRPTNGLWGVRGCQEEGWCTWWLLATLEQREQQVQQPGQRPTVARFPWPRVLAEVLHMGQPGAKQFDPQKRSPTSGTGFTCPWACRKRPEPCPSPPERRAAARLAMSHACSYGTPEKVHGGRKGGSTKGNADHGVKRAPFRGRGGGGDAPEGKGRNKGVKRREERSLCAKRR